MAIPIPASMRRAQRNKALKNHRRSAKFNPNYTQQMYTEWIMIIRIIYEQVKKENPHAELSDERTAHEGPRIYIKLSDATGGPSDYLRIGGTKDSNMIYVHADWLSSRSINIADPKLFDLIDEAIAEAKALHFDKETALKMHGLGATIK